ncbi:MAG: hypothetical protein LBQ64_01505 [Bacteroidales bacterium]|nr:hypothetical protein [Bacteroidales bacterium]
MKRIDETAGENAFACPVRDNVLVENGMSNTRRHPVKDEMWGVFQIIASVKNPAGMELMSKTSYVYRNKWVCFNATPKGSHNRGRHFFYKHLTSSRSNNKGVHFFYQHIVPDGTGLLQQCNPTSSFFFS